MNPTMMKELRLVSTSAFLALAVTAYSGCGRSDLGESCDSSGATDECVDGAICTNLSGGGNVCRKSCTVQADRASNESCNGISNSNLKSCQPS